MVGATEGKPMIEDYPEALRNTSVDEIEWSARVRNCLVNGGIRTLGDIMEQGEYGLMREPNFGSVSLNEVKRALSERGLRLPLESSEQAKEQHRKKLDEWLGHVRCPTCAGLGSIPRLARP